MTLRAGEAKEARARRRPAAVGGVAAPRALDARLHARPARGRQGRARGAPRVLRPRRSARLHPARAARAAGLRGRARAAERRAPARRSSGSRRRDALAPWTERVADARDAARRARAARRSPRSRPASPRARRASSASPDARARATTASRRRAERSRRGSSATSTAARPGSARTSTTSRSRAATATCAASARRASSGSPCSRSCSPRPSCCRATPAAPARRRALGARRRPPRDALAARVAAMGQTVITATQRGSLPVEPAQVVEVTAWTGARAESSRSATRFGASWRASAPQAGLADVVERWPEAVGAAIARNAWPARIARDGTVHVNTADSVWAFELGHRAARDRRARSASPSVRFAPGPLPAARAAPAAARRCARRRATGAGARDRARRADRRTRTCAKVCKKRSLFSLASGRSDRSV